MTSKIEKQSLFEVNRYVLWPRWSKVYECESCTDDLGKECWGEKKLVASYGYYRY